MAVLRCCKCGLIFAPEDPESRAGRVCEHCLRRIRRGRQGRQVFDPRDAPLFRALARERHRPADPKAAALGQPAGLGSILAG